MTRQALDELKQQIPLLDYLQAQDWRAARRLSRGRWMGLYPPHGDRKPSFMVDPNKWAMAVSPAGLRCGRSNLGT